MLIEKPHKDNCELIPIIRPLLIRGQQRGATRLALSKVFQQRSRQIQLRLHAGPRVIAFRAIDASQRSPSPSRFPFLRDLVVGALKRKQIPRASRLAGNVTTAKFPSFQLVRTWPTPREPREPRKYGGFLPYR